jgi:hypothetical protein
MDGRVRIWKRVGKESYGAWEFLANLEGPDEVTVRYPSPFLVSGSLQIPSS